MVLMRVHNISQYDGANEGSQYTDHGGKIIPVTQALLSGLLQTSPNIYDKYWIEGSYILNKKKKCYIIILFSFPETLQIMRFIVGKIKLKVVVDN